MREKTLTHPDFPGWELEGFDHYERNGARSARIFYNGVLVGEHYDERYDGRYGDHIPARGVAISEDKQIQQLIDCFHSAAMLREEQRRDLERAKWNLESAEQALSEIEAAREALGLVDKPSVPIVKKDKSSIEMLQDRINDCKQKLNQNRFDKLA